MHLRRLSLALCVLLVFVSIQAVAAGPAKNTMTVNGKTVNLKYVHAMNKPNPFDKKKTDVFVIFTDKELPEGALFDEFALMTLADKGTTGASVQIDGDKQVISGQLFSPNFKKMSNFSSTGSQKLEVKNWTKDRIAGSVTLGPADFFEEKYQYAVTFDVPIEAKPKPKPLPGTALPAGGGEVGKAYESYRKFMAAGDLPGIRKSVITEMAKQTESPDFKEMLPMIQSMQPKKIKITGGAVDGDNATLLVTSLDEKNTTGTVTMKKEGGQWKVGKESWKTTSGD